MSSRSATRRPARGAEPPSGSNPREDGTIELRAPDLPGLCVIAPDEAAAMARAPAALAAALDAYTQRGEARPEPSDLCGAPTVSIDATSRS